MRRTTFLVLALVLILGLAGCGASAPKVEWELKIDGAVSNPLTLSFADLVKMPQVDLKDILMEKSTGEDVVTNWSGVSLDALLAEAGAPAAYASITAMAGDGYAIEITKDEIEGAIVALKDGGEWIAESDVEHGPIRLVCPHTPGNRWVFQLQQLTVNQ